MNFSWPAIVDWFATLPRPHFLWPHLLWLLTLLPFLILLYVLVQRRRRQNALRYASLSIVRDAMGKTHAWRRHLPPLLFLVGLALLLIASARPTAVLTLPSNQQTIVLAMDVSASMRATDVKPDRLIAAQNAAKTFLRHLPHNVRVAIVAFAGTAQVVQGPTLNRQDLVDAINRFQLQRATATGNAIVVSLATLFPDAGITLEQITVDEMLRQRGRALNQPRPQEKSFTPVPPGSYPSAAIVMLTDGQRTMGVDPLEAASMAAERGVRVYTVGVGTVEGEVIGFEGWSMRVRLDEDTLKTIARQTAAEYYHAGTAQDLEKVYQNLSSRLVFEKKETEVSGLFALAGALLMVLAAALSMWWFGRIL